VPAPPIQAAHDFVAEREAVPQSSAPNVFTTASRPVFASTSRGLKRMKKSDS